MQKLSAFSAKNILKSPLYQIPTAEPRDHITISSKMPNIFSSNTLQALVNITRITSPTGYLLCYFPATYGLLLANTSWNNIYYLILFFIGSILVRSAGCIINDFIDRDLDKYVKRTENRPLANGSLSLKYALYLLVILGVLSFSILITLPKTAIYLGLIAALLVIIYPMMKRITYYPQIFLGFAFNMGCLIGYSTHTNDLSVSAIILYLGCASWTIAFDAIYGFMDISDDKKIGIKSIAIILEQLPYKMILSILYIMFFLAFLGVFYDVLSLLGLSFIIIAMLVAMWSVYSLKILEANNCLLRFKINNLIGFMLFSSIFLEKL